MHRPGVELAISRSQVRHPSHYTTEPPWDWTILTYRLTSDVFGRTVLLYALTVNTTPRLKFEWAFIHKLSTHLISACASHQCVIFDACIVVTVSTFGRLIGLLRRLFGLSRSVSSCCCRHLRAGNWIGNIEMETLLMFRKCICC